MKISILLASYFLLLTSLQASWFWPFGDDDVPERVRLSELMEPATTNIDAAVDFAAEGKYKEAQECYRAAIEALRRIEAENPERAATAEFATVRNKRAYINAALDSMLLAEARENAKAVAVTDTTELEVELALRPWKEYLPTYVALTNADRIVGRRLTGLAETNRAVLVELEAACARTRAPFLSAHASAERAVANLERFAKTASDAEGGRVFDVCRKDLRTALQTCREAWPKFGADLERLAQAVGDVPDVPVQEEDDGLVKDDGDTRPLVESQLDAYMEQERKHNERIQNAATRVKVRKGIEKEVRELLEEDPKSRRARMLMAGEELRKGDTAAAKARIKSLLDEKPNDGPALNMRAAIEAAEGDLKAAEKTLDQAIQSNPRDYHAYYNMANVYLERGNPDGARRYYETGRSFAGPKDAALEKAVRER